ncbi:MAG: sodium:solute symporter [Bacteroidetes bacterium]|nr:MAG: sodium:solute symporter [Bacteroidota bacterium]
MSSTTFLLIAGIYISLLFFIAFLTGRNKKSADFYLANHKAPWFVVAFGMVGASLSGVTFISIPGWVESQSFTYLQMVLGYMVGYIFIMVVLLPLYYKLGLTSIYSYLDNRFGNHAYKTGASFFMLSRIIGASFRLFLVAIVVELAILEPFFSSDGLSSTVPNWAFAGIVAIVLLVIYLYTRSGGMATVIWTDTVQTACMLGAVILTVLAISDAQGVEWTAIPDLVRSSGMTKVFVFDDWKAGNHFVKHFLAGVFVCIAMTGLDQDMMQKNLSCKNLRSARLNMGSFAIVLFMANVLFLSLGALLYIHAASEGISIPEATDKLFPILALGGTLGTWIGGVFLVGLLASAFSSADSALTALTTSACVDLIGTEKMEEAKADRTRKRVHIGMAVVLFIAIMAFRAVNDTSVVAALFTAANYTYGPLLGLFFFGLISKRTPSDSLIPIVAISAPIICYLLELYLKSKWGFSFGFALLPVNGLITGLGLYLLPSTINKLKHTS